MSGFLVPLFDRSDSRFLSWGAGWKMFLFSDTKRDWLLGDSGGCTDAANENVGDGCSIRTCT